MKMIQLELFSKATAELDMEVKEELNKEDPKDITIADLLALASEDVCVK